MAMKSVCIVSCTAHKRGESMPAEKLYSSELFYKCRRYAQSNYDEWLILSAKHGLIKPCEIVAPYDCNLNTLSRVERRALAERISRQASIMFLDRDVELSSLCGEDYDDLLDEAGIRFYRKPEFALAIGMKLQALGAATDPDKSREILDATYKVLWRLTRKSELRRLASVIDDDMPASGVYLFFDERERRLKHIDQLRVVRVGTHGVASGSKASLRSRMRTHFGTSVGEGNHRSSVFRLHVGRSLINAKLTPLIPSWGTPVASKDALQDERELEQAVSKYLAGLLVLLIAIPGESDKTNDRAYIEQNLIALLSNRCKPLDPPSADWLGLRSPKQEIRKSGLWNINHVDQRFDPAFLDVLDYYAKMTATAEPIPEKRIAPQDWYARVRDDARQLTLI